jgi:hypothetical protein
MAVNKTKASKASPATYIAAIGDEPRRRDCAALLKLMAKASGQPAVMWGPAIVGFGVHTYPLAGGKQGEICAVGFSSRKGDISIYGVARAPGAAKLLEKLGTHKLGKGCLYVGRLADLDVKILEQLVSRAVSAKQA